MVSDLVEASEEADGIRMTDPIFDAMATTRSFLFEKVYLGRIGEATRASVEHILLSLLKHFSKEPIPDLEPDLSGEPEQMVS